MNNNFSRSPRSYRQPDPEPDSFLSDGFDNDFGDGFDDDFGSAPSPGRSEQNNPRQTELWEDAPFENQPVQRRPRQLPEEQQPSFKAYGRSAADDTPFVNSAESSPAKPSKLLFCILALLCILAAGLVPSGDVIYSSDNVKGSLSASLDMEVGFDVLMTNVLNAAHGLPKVYALPMNGSPASKPIEENYSGYTDEEGIEHLTYIDETISVDCWRKRYYVNDVSSMVAIAKIKIAHPTQLRSAFAGGQYGTSRLKPSVISSQVNAVVALNGELYNYAGKNHLLIRNGTVYRDGTFSNNDTLFIDSNGDFKIIRDNEANGMGFYNSGERTIYHTVNFGPALVMDGNVIFSDHGVPENSYYRNPRSALGQTGHLEYLFVAAEGRSDVSKGFTTNDLAVLMKDLGCYHAYNVDGGQSSMLIFHNKPFNIVCNGGERTFSDIIYFGSALPEA